MKLTHVIGGTILFVALAYVACGGSLLTALLALLFLSAGIVLTGFLALAVLTYIGLGEPDSNGDPERDAGYSDQEIAEMSACRRAQEIRNPRWKAEPQPHLK